MVEHEQPSMETLIAAFREGGMDRLAEVTDNCPGCMLAAVKQSGVMGMLEDDGYMSDLGIGAMGWSYKEQQKVFWEKFNDSEWDRAINHEVANFYYGL